MSDGGRVLVLVVSAASVVTGGEEVPVTLVPVSEIDDIEIYE